jgi:hypothetical protein
MLVLNVTLDFQIGKKRVGRKDVETSVAKASIQFFKIFLDQKDPVNRITKKHREK